MALTSVLRKSDLAPSRTRATPVRLPCPLGGNMICRSLQDNVAVLAPTDNVARVRIPALDWSVENVEGKKASLAIYSHLAENFGELNKFAAMEGLALFDEVVADARQKPGAHPNIDLLFRVIDENLALELVVETK